MNDLHQIGAIGLIVTAALIWLLGIVAAVIAIGKSLPASQGYTGRTYRDWPQIGFRLGLLLAWLLAGFMVLAAVKT